MLALRAPSLLLRSPNGYAARRSTESPENLIVWMDGTGKHTTWTRRTTLRRQWHTNDNTESGCEMDSFTCVTFHTATPIAATLGKETDPGSSPRVASRS